MSRMWNSYLRILNKYPMRVQIVQTGALMATGDFLSQVALEKRSVNAIDWQRVARFGLIGSLYVGPSIRVWYLAMERIIGSSVTIAATLSKVALDQLTFSPIFSASILSLVGTLQGLDFEGVKKKLDNEWLDILLNGWKIWPAAQLINFYFVPFLIRPLVVACVALFWNTYLAWKANKSIDK